MQSVIAFLKRHPALGYFILTFVISWGGVLVLGAPYGMPTSYTQFQKVWPIVFIPYFLGPALAGLLMTGLVSGREGYRLLGARLRRWRVSVRWYAVAVLSAPILVALVAFLLSLGSSAFLPAVVKAEDKLGMVIQGVMVGLIFGGFLEELGWTGFAVPSLRKTRTVFAVGLIVGLLHGLWHVFPTFWATGDASGSVSLTDFVPPLFFYAGVLPAFRILMVWVYDRSESLLLAMLMHASLTASAPWILLPAVSGLPLVIYYLALIAATWAVVGAVYAALRRPQPQTGPAQGGVAAPSRRGARSAR